MILLSRASNFRFTRRVLLMMLLFPVLLLVATPVQAAPEGWPQGWSEPALLGQTSRGEGAPSLAIDGTGGFYVVYALHRTRPEPDALVVQYLDVATGAKLASTLVPLEGLEGPYLPAAAAAGEQLDIVFQARAGSTYSLRHTQLTRSGTTFVSAESTGKSTSLVESDQFVGEPALARDRNGQLFVAWSQRGDRWEVYAAKLAPGKPGIVGPIHVSDSPDPSIFPTIRVAPGGALVMAWKERRAAELTELHWARVEWPQSSNAEARVQRYGRYSTNNGGSEAEAPGMVLVGEDPVFGFATREFDPELRRSESGIYLVRFTGSQPHYYRIGDVGPTAFLPQLALDADSNTLHVVWATDEQGQLAVFHTSVPASPSSSGSAAGIYQAVPVVVDPQPISFNIPGSYLPAVSYSAYVHVTYLSFAKGSRYDVMYVNTATPAHITLWGRLGLSEGALAASAAWRLVDVTLRALWLELVDAAVLVLLFVAAMAAERTGLAQRLGAVGRLVALAGLLFVLNSPVNPLVFGRQHISWGLDLAAGLLATLGVWLFTHQGRILYPQATTLTGAGLLWDFWYLLLVLLGSPGVGS